MTAPKSGLVAALAEVQKKLPVVKKGETARVKSERTGAEYTYAYADLADIAPKVYALLGEVGLAFICAPQFSGGNYMLVGTLEHESGEKRAGVFPLPNTGKPQDIGSAITYGRRYLLCSLTGVVVDEDDDGQRAQKAASSGQRSQQRSSQRSAARPEEEPPAPANTTTRAEFEDLIACATTINEINGIAKQVAASALQGDDRVSVRRLVSERVKAITASPTEEPAA